MTQAMRAVVTTVGTSLLANYAKAAGEQVRPTAEDLLAYLKKTSVKKASAETNSLSRLKLDHKTDYLYFLCSDTDDGRLCGQTLKQHYEAAGFFFTVLSCLDDLCADHQRFRESGLVNLVNYLADLIEKFERRVVINATGGYKAQIAYATLMGLLYRVEVNYIHEDFAGMVRLPMLPVQFDLAQWESAESGIKAVLSAETLPEARKNINQLPEELRILFAKSAQADKYELSPAGLALQRAVEYALRQKDLTKTPLRVTKAHSTLWGDNIRFVEDIKDEKVRRLLKRLAGQGSLVKAMFLGAIEPHRSEEIFLQFKSKKNGALNYLIHTPEGREYLRVDCPEGLENTLLERLGVKLYP